jgi:flagellar hook-length control protein FliK
MNLTFADINNAFQNLAPSDALPTRSAVSERSGARPSLFANNLRQVIRDTGAVQESVLRKAAVSGTNGIGDQESVDQAKNLLLNELDHEQGLSFLSKLKNFFLTLSEGDLSTISIDAQGLDSLKKMLLKAGFEPGDVEELMDGLSEKSQAGDISLDEVMDSLFKLSTEKEDETLDEEILMETSALPFLTSLLNSLGLPKDAVSQILSQADRGESGISLDVVIDHLKSIENQSVETGVLFKTKEGDTSFTMLFEQLGLSQPENKISQLGLGDLLSSLIAQKEKSVAAKQQADGLASLASQSDGEVKESSNTLIDALFKHLEIQSEQPGLAEFSYEQIKDQFKNDLLIPGKGQPNKNGLFSGEQPGSILKSEQFFKELESLLSGKSGLSDEAKPSVKDGKETTKFSKFESAKGGESSLVSPSDIKTDSLGSAIKAKAAFKSMPTYVMNQVEKSIVRAVNQGENTLKLQLKPAELGRLVMTIDNVGNSMKVSITTENPVAKDILNAHVNELKTVLAAAGISLDKFDVDMNSDFRQSMTDAKNQSNTSNRENRDKKDPLFDSNNIDGMNAGNLAATIQDGSYHFVA